MAGTNPVRLENVYSGVSDFSTSADLTMALAGARAGAVLRLAAPVAPFVLTLANPKIGAVASFVGIVRDVNEGGAVQEMTL